MAVAAALERSVDHLDRVVADHQPRLIRPPIVGRWARVPARPGCGLRIGGWEVTRGCQLLQPLLERPSLLSGPARVHILALQPAHESVDVCRKVRVPRLHADGLQAAQQLPEQAILSLLRRLRPEVYPPATLLIQEGMRNSRLYFISEGVVEVWRAFEVVHQKTLLATLRKNNFFGEFSLMNGGRANATVATISFCDLLILTSEDFDDVLLVYLSRAGPEAITHDLEA